jgi:hypothetical protein
MYWDSYFYRDTSTEYQFQASKLDYLNLQLVTYRHAERKTKTAINNLLTMVFFPKWMTYVAVVETTSNWKINSNMIRVIWKLSGFRFGQKLSELSSVQHHSFQFNNSNQLKTSKANILMCSTYSDAFSVDCCIIWLFIACFCSASVKNLLVLISSISWWIVATRKKGEKPLTLVSEGNLCTLLSSV